MTRTAFITAYAGEMAHRATRDPEYAHVLDMPPDRVRIIADRMTASLAAGTADVHGSPVLRSLARTLGIPHTHNGWRAFASALGD